jgi:hypothetical protein
VGKCKPLTPKGEYLFAIFTEKSNGNKENYLFKLILSSLSGAGGF